MTVDNPVTVVGTVTVADPTGKALWLKQLATAGNIFSGVSGVLGFVDTLTTYVIDKAGWILAKMIIRGIMQSTIQWINNGFQGNPLFVANPEAFFRTVADQAFGQVLDLYLPQICEPFQINIRKELYLRRSSFDSQIRCTLSDAIDNVKGFIDGTANQFGQHGGWREWNIMYTDMSSNPYGASLLMDAKLFLEINAGQNNYQREISLGDGFLNLPEPECAEKVKKRNNGETNLKELGECPGVTPGIVIAHQLNHTLGLGNDSLVEADEVGEVVDALIGALTVKLLTGNGLSGLGGNSNYPSDSFSGALAEESQKEFTREQNKAVSRIASQKTLEGSFASAKEGTAPLVNPVIAAVTEVKTCYIAKTASSSSISLTAEQRQVANDRIQNASSTIADLKEMKNNLLVERDNANINIRNLQRVYDVIVSATYPRDINTLNGALSDESSLRNSLHSSGDLTIAKNEKRDKNPYNNNLEEITNTWNTRLTQCQAFPADVPPLAAP